MEGNVLKPMDIKYMSFICRHDCKFYCCPYKWKSKLKREKYNHVCSHTMQIKNEKCHGMVRIYRKTRESEGLFDESLPTDEEKEFYSELKKYFEKIIPNISKKEELIPNYIKIPIDTISVSLNIHGFPNHCKKFGKFCELGHVSVNDWLKRPAYKLQFRNEIIIKGRKRFQFQFGNETIQWEAIDLSTYDLLNKITEKFKTLENGSIIDQEYLLDVSIDPKFILNMETGYFQYTYSV